MKIGIEAQRIFRKKKHGMDMVALELIKALQVNNTNRLVKNPDWDIGLQKTGYISEAGRCLVMQAQVAGRNLIMVFLDSSGKLSRLGDAERVRKWLEQKSALHSKNVAEDASMPS
jgi:D-alanyl-D-alanine endopeptidase (penicillin-binding protein 7)